MFDWPINTEIEENNGEKYKCTQQTKRVFKHETYLSVMGYKEKVRDDKYMC